MKKMYLILLIGGMILTGCGALDSGPQRVNIRGIVFGTYYSITYYEDDGTSFEAEIDSLLQEFNSSLSFYDQKSLLSRINRNEETRVDDFFEVVFRRSLEISRETDGAFDPTVFPLINAWGFGFSERADMTQAKVDSLLEVVGYEKIRLENGHVVKEDERVQLDFNAIAKGCAADMVGRLLESEGVDVYLVEIGGDLVAKGLKPDGSKWRIGLEIPAEEADAEQQWQYFVEVNDRGLATSGDYRRYYEEDGQRYSHTIDPETGYPVDHHLMSVSVFSSDAMSADAYATAFMVIGLDEAISFVEDRDDLEAYFIFSDEDAGFNHYASTGLD
ncbi:MAG: FAD:protein FMN transferase, partial [Bacteroidales bacterium]